MGKALSGIWWKPFTFEEQEYDLRHLHPYIITQSIEAKGKNPRREFRLNVSYSLHCFTRNPKDGEEISDDLAYSDSREKRIFCFERWELSMKLPEIVRTLQQRRCLHTESEEFVTIEVVHKGRTFDYAVFFTVSKARKAEGAEINLFINSAHERFNELVYKKPISFNIILINKYLNKGIKKP